MVRNLKLWLDDVRPPPDEYATVYCTECLIHGKTEGCKRCADARHQCSGWTWCKSAEEAFRLVGPYPEILHRADCHGRDAECATCPTHLAFIDFEEWALDHDLGGQLAHYGRGPYNYLATNGYNFLRLCDAAKVPLPPRISIHSTNPLGSLNMITQLGEMVARNVECETEIVWLRNRGRIMDKTPYYEDR